MEESLLEPGTESAGPLAPGSVNYRFRLEDFEGPLDLLLFLIRKNEVNIYDIPIATITEQYLDYLRSAERVALEQLSEFYTLAATLIHLKSKMLLPVEVNLDDELEDPRKELVERLIEYQKYKKLTQLMQEREDSAEWFLERRRNQAVYDFGEDGPSLWEEVRVQDLVQTFAKVMQGLSSERVLSLYEEVSVNEKIALIHEFIDTRIEFSFEDLITRPGSFMDVVCSFLAVLESVKVKLIVVVQHRLFGDIRIRGRPMIDLVDGHDQDAGEDDHGA